PAPAPAASYAQSPPHAQSQTQAPAAQAGAPVPGGLDPRMLWPNILESVKNRRRFTWILLSQNAQVSGFDGTTLQLGFMNAGARDNFASSGSEEVLKQALAEQFNVQWRIEAVVDPTGGGQATPATGGYGGGNAPGGYGGGGGGGGYAAPAAPPAPPL
ncbi:DNA polymerase III subunit gamma/tau, partial [Streptomyces sp. NRRL WC-3618]